MPRGSPLPPQADGLASPISRSDQAPLRHVGVYVHFPYCLRKCPYCDFLSVASEPEAIDHRGYADAVLSELALRRADRAGDLLRSVFFGGGTPSLWNPHELGRVLSAVLASWNTTADKVEVTVECNPSSLDRERARALLDQGVNRLSIGVQSLDAQRLRFLGRLHDAAGGLQAVDDAVAAGFRRLSADLIFGVAGQSADEAGEEARALAARPITHLSAYALTIEPGTQFGALARHKRLPLLAESEVARSFSSVAAALGAAGFEHYEISNFARAGHYAEHNLGYWRGDQYLGLGCGAWGTVQLAGTTLRYRNTNNPERYHQTCLRDGSRPDPWSESELTSVVETINPETANSEAIMLGLRLAKGLDLDALARRTGADPRTPERLRALEKLLRSGRVMQEGSRIWIPEDQRLFSDGIASELM